MTKATSADRPTWRTYAMAASSFLLVAAAPTIPFLVQRREDPGLGIFLAYASLVVIPIGHVILHELAHAAVAKMARLSVVQVVIGTGRPLFQIRLGRCLVTVTRNPGAGGVCLFRTTSPKNLRVRAGLAILAGPILDHGLLLFAVIGLATLGEWSALTLPFCTLAGWTAYSAIRGWWFPRPGLTDRLAWQQLQTSSPEDLANFMRLQIASHNLEIGNYERALAEMEGVPPKLALMFELHCLWRLHGARRALDRLESAASDDDSDSLDP